MKILTTIILSCVSILQAVEALDAPSTPKIVLIMADDAPQIATRMVFPREPGPPRFRVTLAGGNRLAFRRT